MAASSLASADARSPEHSRAFIRLYACSRGEELGLSLEEFSKILVEIAGRYLPAQATETEQVRFFGNLQLEELALARACAKGSDAAWDGFVERYRPKLRNAARSMVKDEAKACELADSLYTELFGTRRTAEGVRVSKLESYAGRGSLDAWLKTVLAQQYVNQIRRERRLVSFDEAIGQPITRESSSLPDVRLEQAIDIAISEVSGEERLLVVSYYLDGRRLAEIGRMIGAHESTVSRRLDRITSALRKRVLRSLREQGMSASDAEEIVASDIGKLSVDFRSRLLKRNCGARSID